MQTHVEGIRKWFGGNSDSVEKKNHSHESSHKGPGSSPEVVIKYRCYKNVWNEASFSFIEEAFDSDTPCIEKKERKNTKLNWEATKWIPGHWEGGKWKRGYFIPGKWTEDKEAQQVESKGFLPPGKGPEGDVPSNFQNLVISNEEAGTVGTRDISNPENIFPKIDWRQVNIRREILTPLDSTQPFWQYKTISKIWNGPNPQIVISKPLRELGDGFAKIKLA